MANASGNLLLLGDVIGTLAFLGGVGSGAVASVGFMQLGANRQQHISRGHA